MRTTMTLDDEVYETVRQRAFNERRSIGEVVSDLTKRGLAAESQAKPRRRLGFWAGQGFIADDFDQTPPEILDAMDEPLL